MEGSNMHMLALFLDDNSINPQMMPGILAAVAGFYLVLFLVMAIVVIIPTWFICKKAGFSPWLSLLIIVPFGGLVLLYVVAFSEWKVAPVTTAVAAWKPPPPPAPPQI
jgi:intracellular septation protein A